MYSQRISEQRSGGTSEKANRNDALVAVDNKAPFGKFLAVRSEHGLAHSRNIPARILVHR